MATFTRFVSYMSARGISKKRAGLGAGGFGVSAYFTLAERYPHASWALNFSDKVLIAMALLGAAVFAWCIVLPPLRAAIAFPRAGAPVLLVSLIVALIAGLWVGREFSTDSARSPRAEDHTRQIAQLKSALEHERLQREHALIDFLGGRTWQRLSESLGELGLSIGEVQREPYGGVRFERFVTLPSFNPVYLYSREKEPEPNVYLEVRIRLDDSCWSAQSPQLGRKVSQIIGPQFVLEIDRESESLMVRRRISVTENATSQFIFDELDAISQTDRAIRNARRDECAADMR